MKITEAQQLIIGKWNVYSAIIGNTNRFTFTDKNVKFETSEHISKHYEVDYSITENQTGIFLKIKGRELEIIAISQKCMVWLENSVPSVLLRKS